ncbi:hypothetical protein M1N67_03910 [Peptococcaceae bacterium]|nr:hypothetical protein [Peptococcaceae bacterium]
MISASFFISNTIIGEIADATPEFVPDVIATLPFFAVLMTTVFILTYLLGGYLYSQDTARN